MKNAFNHIDDKMTSYDKMDFLLSGKAVIPVMSKPGNLI